MSEGARQDRWLAGCLRNDRPDKERVEALIDNTQKIFDYEAEVCASILNERVEYIRANLRLLFTIRFTTVFPKTVRGRKNAVSLDNVESALPHMIRDIMCGFYRAANHRNERMPEPSDIDGFMEGRDTAGMAWMGRYAISKQVSQIPLHHLTLRDAEMIAEISGRDISKHPEIRFGNHDDE